MESNETSSAPPASHEVATTSAAEKSTLPADVESQVASLRSRRRKKFNWNWIVAPLMLIAGVGIGFFGRPYILPEKPASSGDGIVAQLVAQTKHFKGNANAPVTILEFSDFQ